MLSRRPMALSCLPGRKPRNVTSFANCVGRDLEARKFLREDHLSRHIKDAHIKSDDSELKVSKELLQSWQIMNPSASQDSLHCGFCGTVSETRKQRQDHVWDHLKMWVCKSAWWPQRLAQPSSTYHVSNNACSFHCEPCGSVFQDIFDAATTHAMCRTWSCRYLHNEE